MDKELLLMDEQRKWVFGWKMLSEDAVNTVQRQQRI
jgi:hypothetical protein